MLYLQYAKYTPQLLTKLVIFPRQAQVLEDMKREDACDFDAIKITGILSFHIF